MSIVLIHVCGFLTCSAVAVIGLKSLYRNSQNTSHPDDYPENIPLEDRNVLADVVGLSIEIARSGMDNFEHAADKIFDSKTSQRFRQFCSPLQVKPDGEYFEFKTFNIERWNGYTDDPPKTKPGKFEMEI